MNRRAWTYIWCAYAVGALFAVQAYFGSDFHHTDWTLAELLIGLAVGAQLFKVEAPNHVLFYATPVFYFAAAILLDPFQLFLVIALPHLAEWIRERWSGSDHLRAWYLQPFNIAMYWISTRVAQAAYLHFHPHAARGSVGEVIAVLTAALIYVAINHVMLGLALVLARRISWSDSGVLDGENLTSDFVLVCLGTIVAFLYPVQPWYIIPALTPLALMYQALMVPRLKQEAERDAKTGLYNARYFNTLFEAELNRADRFDRPMACIMADLDLLRQVNNLHGHLAGDAVLTGIGDVIRTTIRDYDIAGRFGGEEFALILPEIDEIQAREMAERLRRSIEAKPFNIGNGEGPIHVTMSLGVACFPQDGRNTTELMHAADVAAYAAKSGGRNRVVCASDVHDLDTSESTRSAGGPSPASASLPAPKLAMIVDEPPLPEETRSDVAEKDAGSRWVHTSLIVGVILAGLCATAIGIVAGAPFVVGAIGLLTLLAVMAELLEVDLYGQGTVSVSVGIAFTAALSTGIDGLACVSAGIALVHHVKQGRALYELHRALFNWAVHVLAGLVVVIMVMFLHMPIRTNNFLWLAPAMTVAAVAYYAVETGLIAAAVALARGDKVIRTWRTNFRWLLTHYVVLCLMGLVLSVTFAELGGIGIAIFTLPLFMMHYVQKQYVAQTKESLHALQRLNRDLLRAAHHDHLTGLGNERGYQEIVRREVCGAVERQQPLVLARLNVDEFKDLNAKFGRQHGDRVLIELAVLLRTAPNVDHAFRLAGDEFSLILPNVSLDAAIEGLDKLRQIVPERLGGSTISIGVTALHHADSDPDLLTEQSVEALLAAKRRGRNLLILFDEIRDSTLVASSAQAQAVRRLLTEGDVSVVFQPIWDIDMGVILGYEALSRPSTAYGLVGPQEAFDVATRLGRAHDLDALCREAILGRAHELPAGARLFINLAPETLEHNPNTGATLLAAVRSAGLTPQQVVLELTERSIVRPDTVVREAERLRELGFQLALDDTGAGNAGLGVLSQLKVDFVKVDRGVVTHAGTDQAARAVLAGIIALAREMGAYVIAEGIETVEMLDLVREISFPVSDGVDRQGRGVQGYLLGRPSTSLLDSAGIRDIAHLAFGATQNLIPMPPMVEAAMEGRRKAVAW